VTIREPGRKDLVFSYWDLWMALAAEKECGGDLDRLAERMRAERDKLGYGGIHREEWKARLSHLRDLQKRLRDRGLDAMGLVRFSDELAIQERRRAWRVVMEKPARDSEWSAAMRCTPEDRGMTFALRGHWDRFPESPAPFAEEIVRGFKSGFYTESQSFKVAERLDRFIDRGRKFLSQERHADALAVLRAVLTETIEVMRHADDSYGCIGDAFGEALKEYMVLPFAASGIDEVVFFHDLLTLLIWENYGMSCRRTDGYFRRLSREQGDLCLAFLRGQIPALKADDLDYRAEDALTLFGQVAWEQCRIELLEGLAREMGSRHWERILRLVDAAMKKRKRDLALRVFEAALQTGPHLKWLQEHYESLKAGHWPPAALKHR